MQRRLLGLVVILVLLTGSVFLFGHLSVAQADGFSWSQVATGGDYDAKSMAVYNGKLYVGNWNPTYGCQVWRYNGSSWNQVNTGGFGDTSNEAARSMAVYNGNLYVGTVNNTDGCEVWRYNGSSWKQVNTSGFGDTCLSAYSMAVYDGNLYLGTEITGTNCQVWRYNGSTWVNMKAFGGTNSGHAGAMAVYDGNLYVSGSDGGCQIWRYNGSAWKQVNTSGFGETHNLEAYSMEVFDGSLFVGTVNDGCQVWRYSGSSWSKVATNGFGDPDNRVIYSMATYNGNLYAATSNMFGCQVWCFNGSSWNQVNTNGFGDGNNWTACGIAVYNGNLYVGTGYVSGGLQVWRYGAEPPPPPKPTTRISATDSIGTSTPATTWYLAEGATLGGFETWILVQNPGSETADVQLTYQTDKGEVQGPALSLAPKSRESVNVADTVQTFKVSTVVSSSKRVVAERAVYLNNRHCATDSIGATAPSKTWYLAEGATLGGFETWILVQNPGSETANVQLTYQTDKGEVQGPALNLAPKSRESINVANTVQTYQVSTVVSSNNAVVAERAVYCGNRTLDGTDSIGVTQPSKTWYLAEGATLGGFETWILVQNPNSTAANVQITYQTDKGEVPGPSFNLAAKSRQSVNVADTVQTYKVSTVVNSNIPVVAERAVYFNNKTCATDSIGLSAPARTWYLAEGATLGGFETWILVQNPNGTTANVQITYQTDKGEVPGPSFNLAAKSRQSVNVADTVQTYKVSTVVNSNIPVVAERAMYFSI